MTSVLHAAALQFAAQGIPVFPLQPRSKDPLRNSRGFHDATTDADRINSWWKQIPELNVGFPTGEPSGLFVVDVDGDDGRHSLAELEEKHSLLPPTISVITGRDGRGEHLYFQLGKHSVRNSAGLVGPGIDVRGTGGYVVAPPSIHPSGRVYAWSVDSSDSFAPAPDWLLSLIETNNVSGKPLLHWHHTLTEPIPQGQRNATLASLCGKLLHSGLSDLVLLFDVMLCVNAARCTPPIQQHEVETIVSSVMRSHLRKVRANA
jgi:hypothetical protein